MSSFLFTLTLLIQKSTLPHFSIHLTRQSQRSAAQRSIASEQPQTEKKHDEIWGNQAGGLVLIMTSKDDRDTAVYQRSEAEKQRGAEEGKSKRA